MWRNNTTVGNVHTKTNDFVCHNNQRARKQGAGRKRVLADKYNQREKALNRLYQLGYTK